MELLKDSSCVQSFDIDGEKATLGTRWLEYMEDIDIYLEAANINDEGRKKAIMLHLGGQALRRVAKTLDCTPRAEVQAQVGPPVVAAVPAESPYAALKRVLTQAHSGSLYGVYPVVTVELFGEKCEFLLDTGSNSTIVSQRVYRAINGPFLRSTSKRIFPFSQSTPVKHDGSFSA